MVGMASRSVVLWSVLLLAALGAVYLPGVHNELIFDDQILSSGRLFEHYGGITDLKQRLLSYGSFVWIEALLGDGWWKQRLVNLALHAMVVAALFSLFRTLTARVEWPDDVRNAPHFEQSLLAALRVGVAVFALNPVAVYAVAYLIQRSILGATLFVVLACIAFSRGVLSGRAVWFAAAAASYVLAVLCKEHALMAPALAVPLYVFLKRPGWRRIAMIVAACIALVGAAIGALLAVYGEIIGVPFDDLSAHYIAELRAIAPDIEARAWPLSVLNQAALFFYYGFLWFVPNVLWMSIDLRPQFPVSFGSVLHLAGAAGYAGLLLGSAWLVLRRSDALGFLGLCLLFPLLLFFTEFSTVWIQDPFVLYRSYLWAIAIPGLVTLVLLGLKPHTLYTIGFVLVFVFGGLALERVLSLKNELSVWSDAVDKIDLQAPPSAVGRWRPFLNRGSYYLEHTLVDLAYRDFVQAEALGEPQGSARFNMGVSLQLMQRHEEAVEALDIAEDKGFDEWNLYFHRAESKLALGRFDPAMTDLDRALERVTSEEHARHVRGRRAQAALRTARYEVARLDFEALLRATPDDFRSELGLGMALVGLRDAAAALPRFNALIERQPHPSVFYGRALALSMLGRRSDAIADIDRAIGLDPNNAVYRNLRSQLSQRP